MILNFNKLFFIIYHKKFKIIIVKIIFFNYIFILLFYSKESIYFIKRIFLKNFFIYYFDLYLEDNINIINCIFKNKEDMINYEKKK